MIDDEIQDFDHPTEYPPIDESETDSCRALWVSVAIQAVVDARSNRNRPEHRRHKKEALEWLEAKEGDESELAEICSLAGLDFETTRRKLLEFANDENEGLNFRCLRKAVAGKQCSEQRSKYLQRMRRREKARKAKIEKPEFEIR